MTTQSLASNTLRFSKIILAITALALGSGLGSASAGLLTPAQAKAAASQISAYKQYNAAYAVARDVTANTGAQYAAFNARLIAKYLGEDKIALMAAVINGVSFNYPNQQAAIVTQVISLNKDTRENGSKILALVGKSLSSDATSQIAVGLNYSLLRGGENRSQAGLLAYILLSSINNSATGTAADRANEMAITAGNLAANLLTPNKCGSVSKENQNAFNQIAYVLASFAKTADTGLLTRDQLINNIVGNFAAAIKASAPGSQSTNTLNRIRTVLVVLIPGSSSTINKVIQDVIDTGGFTDPVGPVTPPETPHS